MAQQQAAPLTESPVTTPKGYAQFVQDVRVLVTTWDQALPFPEQRRA